MTFWGRRRHTDKLGKMLYNALRTREKLQMILNDLLRPCSKTGFPQMSKGIANTVQQLHTRMSLRSGKHPLLLGKGCFAQVCMRSEDEFFAFR